MHFAIPFHKYAGRAALGGLLVLAATLRPLAASAHFEGDSWSWGGGHNLLWINYDNNCSPFTGVVDSAAGGWTATSTPIAFSKQPSGCSPMDQPVDIFTGYNSNVTALAWTQNYERDCFISCWWDADWDDTIEHSVIRLNTAVDGNNSGFSTLSGANQQAVVTHEMGHSLGMAHAGYYAGESVGAYSIMDYCCFGYSTPQTHDVNDVNALYPGW